MELSPKIYSWLIRPKFAIKKYIQKPITDLANLTGKDVLDFGCGTGSNAFIFNKGNYTGVDVDKNRITLAKNNFPQLSFYHFDGKLPFKDNSFDYIFVIATIHHIKDIDFKKILLELNRILRHGGSFMVLDPVLMPRDHLRNWFMNFFDAGKYIRSQENYLYFFRDFETRIIKTFTKFALYNEILFTARKT